MNFDSNKVFFNELLSSEKYDRLRSFSILITSLVSIVNIGWIISYSISENIRKQKIDRLEKTSFWFRDVVLKNNTDKIAAMFDDIVSIVLLIRGNRDIEKYVEINQNFIEKKQNLIAAINDQLIFINNDFAETLDTHLDNFQDEFTNKLEEYLTEPFYNQMLFDELVSLINKNKRTYTGMLFDFEMNGYIFKKEKTKIIPIFVKNHTVSQ
jgi:hypothetical protein